MGQVSKRRSETIQVEGQDWSKVTIKGERSQMNRDREVKTQIYNYENCKSLGKSGPQFAQGDLNKSSCIL